jgi:hypothetical protein
MGKAEPWDINRNNLRPYQMDSSGLTEDSDSLHMYVYM